MTDAETLAVFRCDASPSVGYGHLRRCEALAAPLRRAGWTCEFATDGETPEALRAAWPGGTAILVADSYALDAAFEAACRPWAANVVAIDDAPSRTHDADVLIDQNAGRSAADYYGRVPDGCRILAGPGFALLAEDYPLLREITVPREKAGRPPRLLVSLGGGDGDATRTALETVLDGIDACSGAGLATVVVPSEALAKEAARRGHDVRRRLTPGEMARLAAESDVAIGAGGVSLLERCCLGLPAIVVTLADNQRPGTEAAAALGACRDLGSAEDVTPADVADALKELLEDADLRHAVSAAAARTTDGAGAARAAAAIAVSGGDETGGALSLRRAAPSDCDLLLGWQRHPDVRRFARNPAVPDADEHASWFADRLGRGGCYLNVVTVDEEPAGMLRLDRLDAERRGYEVSILTAPGYRGRGVARAALGQARHLARGETLWAWVAEENAASHALFRSAGFRPETGGWYAAGGPREAA